MHETGMIRDLIKKVDHIVRDNAGARAKAIKVRLGALAHISADHFREHFDEESVGTLAQGAELQIEESVDTYESTAQDIILQSVEVEIAVM